MNIPTMPLREFSTGNRQKLARRPLPTAHRQPSRPGWMISAAVAFATLLFLLLVHCAPSVPPVPPRAKLAPAARQPSAIPSIEAARKLGTEADSRSASAYGKVGTAKSGMQESHAEIQSLASEVERLHKQKTAGENELLALYNRLVAQERKFAVMVSDLVAAQNDLDAERALRLQQTQETIKAQQLATAKEAEATQNATRADFLEAEVDAYQKSANQHAAANAANAARADKAAGTISSLHRVILIGCILLVLSVGANILQLKTGIL